MNRIFNNKGAISILIALSMVVLMGFAAISIDVGWMLHHKSELQNSADAAALAGAIELPDKEESKTVVEKYMIDNELGEDRTGITVNHTGDRTYVNTAGEGSFYFDTKFEGEHKVIITAHKPIDYFFARIFNKYDGIVCVKSKAIIAPVRNVLGGLRPFGVVESAWEPDQQVVLKTGAPNEYSGNFYALALKKNEAGEIICGGNVYKEMIIDGCPTPYAIGDTVTTETGNMVGPTKSGVEELIKQCNHSPKCTSLSYQLECPRVVLIPLVDTIDVNGRKEITIVGFGQFFVEDVDNKAGHTEITGRFIKKVTPGEMDPDAEDFGAIGVRLVFPD